MICSYTLLDCNSHNGLWQSASWSCCTNEDPCGLGAGDCDNDHECAGDLTCGNDNCMGSIFPSSADCCENPATTHITTTKTTTTTTTITTTMTTCADIWSATKCKEKKKAGECDTSCTTDDCIKTQKKCKKKCKIC